MVRERGSTSVYWGVISPGNRGPQFCAILRRAANLNLREVADKMGVSPGRISQIQRTIEAEEPELVLARLKRRYKVKA